jgi:hypothetical protein
MAIEAYSFPRKSQFTVEPQLRPRGLIYTIVDVSCQTHFEMKLVLDRCGKPAPAICEIDRPQYSYSRSHHDRLSFPVTCRAERISPTPGHIAALLQRYATAQVLLSGELPLAPIVDCETVKEASAYAVRDKVSVALLSQSSERVETNACWLRKESATYARAGEGSASAGADTWDWSEF